MEGEGELSEWLKQTGREVARAAGNELKSVAKDKAASYARDLIGMGLKEALGDAAGAVGKAAVGEAKKQALNQAQSLLGFGIQDVLGDAAGAVSKAAIDEAKKQGKHHAKALISKYFGGDGITRPCAIKISDLRKAVTAARRANHVTGPASKDQLLTLGAAHTRIPGKHAERIRKGYLLQKGVSVSDLREMRGFIKSAYHMPVSRMSAEELRRYVYLTAKYLQWSWTQLDGLAEKSRQPRGCRGSAAPGRSSEAPEYGTSRSKRKPSAYNKFVKLYIQKAMADFDSGKRRPEGWKAPMAPPTVADYMKEAAVAWKSSAGRRSATQKGAQTRRNKKEEAERRAQVRKEVQAERLEAANTRAKSRRAAHQQKFGTRKIPKKRDRLPRAAKGDGWDY
eukprot:COSAG02_NODE_4527_length_5256_cov_7.579794_5_plen_394_part_00